MAWEKLAEKYTRRYNFAKMGEPDLWVELRSPLVDTLGAQMDLMEIVNVPSADNVNPDQAKSMFKYLARYIVDWNLVDENGTPLDVPTPQNYESLFKLPTAVVNQIQEWLEKLGNPTK